MTNDPELSREELLNIIEEAGKDRTWKKTVKRVVKDKDGNVIEETTTVEDVTLKGDPEAAEYARKARRRFPFVA